MIMHQFNPIQHGRKETLRKEHFNVKNQNKDNVRHWLRQYDLAKIHNKICLPRIRNRSRYVLHNKHIHNKKYHNEEGQK